MNAEQRKQLAIEIIRNDLKVTLLLEGLNRTGLDAGDYLTGLGGVVFTLMGLSSGSPHPEKLYAAYLKRTRRVRRLNPARAYTKLLPMAKDIYRWLETKSS